MLRRIEAFILLTLLSVLSIFALNWAFKGAIHSQKDVLVPDLVGQPTTEALSILSKQNLGLKQEDTEFNDTLPAGTVLRQQPAAGMSVREGKIVRVTISQGGETVFVPDLIGQSLRSAEISLRSNFLSLGEIQYRPSMKYEKDFVVSQDPPAKKIVTKNSFVHINVSNGPPEDGSLLMPEFVGKNWSEVISWSKEDNINLEVTEEISTFPPETVLQQGLPSDSPFQPGSTVKFVVASANSGSSYTASPVPTRSFKYEVPQGESPKEYVFVFVDTHGKKELFRGSLNPGTKKSVPLPEKIVPPASIRIFVNGILTHEQPIQ